MYRIVVFFFKKPYFVLTSQGRALVFKRTKNPIKIILSASEKIFLRAPKFIYYCGLLYTHTETIHVFCVEVGGGNIIRPQNSGLQWKNILKLKKKGFLSKFMLNFSEETQFIFANYLLKKEEKYIRNFLRKKIKFYLETKDEEKKRQAIEEARLDS